MTDDDKQTPDDRAPRRGGRAPSGKRGKFAFRVTAELREKLEAAAAASGRPVSEEIEMRLEASFREPEIIEDAVDRAKNAMLDVLVEKEKKNHGGPYGTYAGLVFGNMLSERVNEAKQMFGSNVEWIFDDAMVGYVYHAMQNTAGLIIVDVVKTYRNSHQPISMMARGLGIDIEGLTEDQMREKVADHFKQHAPPLR
ncbi:Arc family DNA-binding protein [Methylobacterium indicum]|uniref:Arc-like DNA binding domain-containing protein n=1 Tax=Methylobacterium indicum TaxID=1775910 RepID=A0A8H9C9F4_9HYPH|nr:Arc family DNA-binding protein [Methylobacterium indicum]BCM88097.1 hypothetical protein mvi_65580 [Methylobacterium indicum]